MRALERDAKSQRDLFESYLAKYREATARDSIGAASPDARVISTATPSNLPSWPKKLPTVLVAALGMFALAVGFVLTGELLSGAPGARRHSRIRCGTGCHAGRCSRRRTGRCNGCGDATGCYEPAAAAMTKPRPPATPVESRASGGVAGGRGLVMAAQPAHSSRWRLHEPFQRPVRRREQRPGVATGAAGIRE